MSCGLLRNKNDSSNDNVNQEKNFHGNQNINEHGIELDSTHGNGNISSHSPNRFQGRRLLGNHFSKEKVLLT